MLGLLDNNYQKNVLTKWSGVLEAGPEIKDEYTKLATAQVLETTHRDFIQRGIIKEESGQSAGSTGPKGTSSDQAVSTGVLGPGDYNWPSIVVPMVRRIFPNLMAHQLVGVQPMNGPVGFAFALRAKYGANGRLGAGNLNLSNTEIGYNNMNTAYTGTSGNTSVPGVTGVVDVAGDAWKAYAGIQASTGDNYFLGDGVTAASGEYATVNGTYPMAKFDLIKSAVEAKTRKLGANWSPELAEDMMAMHGTDVEVEMINILTYEIGAEIDRQLLSEMVKAAIVGNMVSTWTPVSADGRHQLERIGTLLTHLTERAMQIAVNTRRGNANFCVTSPKVAAVLQQLTANRFVKAEGADIPGVPNSGVGSLVKVGLINDGSQLLIRDTFAGGDYALLGYKGIHPGDSGIIYTPYIPVQLAKVISNTDFSPAIGARTRYGVMNTPWDAKNYYQFVTISNMANVTLAGDGSRVFTY